MVRQFLVSVNNQFGATPFIVLMATAIIVLFFFFLYFVNKLQQKKVRKRRKNISDEIYTKYVQKLALTPSQEQLLFDLAKTLREPDILYPLLLDEHVFEHAVKQYCSSHPVPPELPALRKTIGFAGLKGNIRERNVYSTVQLVNGQTISIEYPKKRVRVSATITDVRKDGFLVSPAPFIFLDIGSEVHFRFFNNRGQYAGSSYVRSHIRQNNEDLFLLSHCESITKTQKRKFFRKQYSSPCTVTKLGDEESSTETTFIELGGGGASIKNRDDICVAGDIVVLDWKSSHGALSVRGKVVRITGRKQQRDAHIEFEGINSRKRDLLFKILLHPSEAQTS